GYIGMLRKITRQAWLVCSLSLFIAGQVYAQAGSGAVEFREGVSAFRAGDYNRALLQFQASRQQGNQNPRLIYNLAVTHYQLQQFNEADRLFRTLVTDPQWGDLSRYNLGLIAKRRGDRREAERWFRQVYDTSANEKLVYLAGEGLRDLGVAVRPGRVTPSKNWFTLLSLSGGYDDNAIAFPDSLQTQSSQGADTFVELLGYGQVYLSGDAGDGTRLHGFAHTKQYNDLDVVDTLTLSAGLTQGHRYRDWSIEYGAGVGYTGVDGNRLSTQLQGNLGLRRLVGASEYAIHYRPVYHDGGGDFGHLDGMEHRMDLRWRHRVDNGRLTARYRLEVHDRDDVTAGDTFLSYSPVKHGVLLQWDWYLSPAWTFTAGGGYTNSSYGDINRLTDTDGVFKEQKRKSDMVEALAKLQYQFTSRWSVLGEYRYQNNDDNFELFSYKRNEVKVSIEFAY
ncbi:MAG: tetratricopeptide repeat protein, partial [Gammaproteobacteria bacterium]